MQPMKVNHVRLPFGKCCLEESAAAAPIDHLDASPTQGVHEQRLISVIGIHGQMNHTKVSIKMNHTIHLFKTASSLRNNYDDVRTGRAKVVRSDWITTANCKSLDF